jgi:hypothetical protein
MRAVRGLHRPRTRGHIFSWAAMGGGATTGRRRKRARHTQTLHPLLLAWRLLTTTTTTTELQQPGRVRLTRSLAVGNAPSTEQSHSTQLAGLFYVDCAASCVAAMCDHIRICSNILLLLLFWRPARMWGHGWARPRLWRQNRNMARETRTQHATQEVSLPCWATNGGADRPVQPRCRYSLTHASGRRVVCVCVRPTRLWSSSASTRD